MPSGKKIVADSRNKIGNWYDCKLAGDWAFRDPKTEQAVSN